MSDPYIAELARLRNALEASEARADKLQREKDEMERENRRTTLDEYLRNCHTQMYLQFKIARPSVLTTGFTGVQNKFYPKWLRPWTSFQDELRLQQFELIRTACGSKRIFSPESNTKEDGDEISDKPAGNEQAVMQFEIMATERPVSKILKNLASQERICNEYGFSNIQFRTDGREIEQQSSGSQSVNEDGQGDASRQKRLQTGRNRRVASSPGLKPRSTVPDGFGLRTGADGERSTAFVYDFKAAHMIAVECVRQAVAKETLFMEVVAQTNSNKSKTGIEKDEFEAESLIAMALVQVFDYMVMHGVAYGYVATGKTLLLLYFDRSDPQTLYCHVCVPEEDVGQVVVADWPDNMINTAVVQLASFVLLALKSDAIQGALLDEAQKSADKALETWPNPYQDATEILASEDTASSATPSPPSIKGKGRDKDFDPDASPTGRKISTRCRPLELRSRTIGSDEEPDDGPPSSSRQRGTAAGKQNAAPSSSSRSSSKNTKIPSSVPTRRYCSQSCLLGLKRGWDLDEDCPNALSHRDAGADGMRHPITADEFTRLVGERLVDTPYVDCQALNSWGKRGAIGVLFKVELATYGYTFVAKGVRSHHLERLQHEGRVYARLETLQGWVVPVHLGLVHLNHGYLMPGGARMVHMMLMSWGGEFAVDAGLEEADLEAQRERSLQAFWAKGVAHGDISEANLLWNTERKCVMIIDFDRADLGQAINKRLLISGTKRKFSRAAARTAARADHRRTNSRGQEIVST